MVNINFVPEDYVEKRQSKKANLMCLVLLGILMLAIGGNFAIIKLRQRALNVQTAIINAKMAEAAESIRQLDQLQQQRKEVMKTAMATADLIEPVSRSILLALLTNDLPSGTSLLMVKVVQKEPANVKSSTSSSTGGDKYQAAKGAKAATTQPAVSKEKLMETRIEIEGIAPSDIEVASYIASLNSSILLDEVALVLSKEHKIKDSAFREFKLTAMLKKNVQLSKNDIEGIRMRHDR